MIQILTLIVSCAALTLLIIDRVHKEKKPQEKSKEKKDNTEAKKNRDEIERKLKAIEDFE